MPTDVLYGVPWGVLPSLQSRPIVVTPSATAWLAAERAELPRDGQVVLVRGPELPAAQGEIDKLATHYEAATLRSGRSATIGSVLGAL